MATVVPLPESAADRIDASNVAMVGSGVARCLLSAASCHRLTLRMEPATSYRKMPLCASGLMMVRLRVDSFGR
ncbi:hypothetical protein D3C83_121930 [compost metagenome]